MPPPAEPKPLPAPHGLVYKSSEQRHTSHGCLPVNSPSAMAARAERNPPWMESLAKIRGWFVFAREAFANPREIGAVVPSSPALARRMARLVSNDPAGLVVELGAGTGVVTEALLNRGIPPNRLFAIELSESLTRLLRKRFLEVQVLCGDAANLRRLLRRAGADAHGCPVTIVSSLPLRSLPAPKVNAIVREISALIRPSGSWIQYTYALAHRQFPTGFTRSQSSFVWGNIPPARVDVLIPTGKR
jgi:phosphatidylethanolamine/phosphatidyl-N-methylethanolamine N-methyltransferase